jgi:hypothetical protein
MKNKSFLKSLAIVLFLGFIAYAAFGQNTNQVPNLMGPSNGIIVSALQQPDNPQVSPTATGWAGLAGQYLFNTNAAIVVSYGYGIGGAGKNNTLMAVDYVNNFSQFENGMAVGVVIGYDQIWESKSHNQAANIVKGGAQVSAHSTLWGVLDLTIYGATLIATPTGSSNISGVELVNVVGVDTTLSHFGSQKQYAWHFGPYFENRSGNGGWDNGNYLALQTGVNF